MKQLFSLLMAVMVSLGAVQACMKKARPVAVDTVPLVVLVTDTTQALLQGAELKIGKTTLRTSWDGRVVIAPELLNGCSTLSVDCKGYESRKISSTQWHDCPLLIVALTPKAGRAGKTDYMTFGTGRRHVEADGVLYRTKTLAAVPEMAMEAADYAVAGEEPELDRPRILPAYNEVTAGKLTAGEVNDFAKWSFWPTVLDSTHRRYVNEWRMEARERYTVQVVDKHGYPVANYPVNLTDTKGNTVFQAMTDNTGKAELWNGLIGPRAEVNQPQWQTLVVDMDCDGQTPGDPSDVDVLFVFDATGSMGDELMYLQAEMKDVISRATEATGGLTIRTGAVVYRDHGDEYLTRISRLTTDIATTQTFIDKQEAAGGGDYPEAVPEALMAALNCVGWNEQARARIAFLILDAPSHQDSATLALLHEQIYNAAAQGVRLVPVVCSGIEESGEYMLRTMALATNGTSFFLTDDSGIGHPHIKPTTDSLKVEHLNDMLVRTIVEFSYMPDCHGQWHEEQIDHVEQQFVPNPFEPADIQHNPTIQYGPTTLYLLDISGKLLTVYQGRLEDAGDAQLAALGIPLSTGIYFIKAFYDGQWHTRKILVH